jgi:hypothetical protein
MASNKGLSIYSLVNIITADLAHLDFFLAEQQAKHPKPK